MTNIEHLYKLNLTEEQKEFVDAIASEVDELKGEVNELRQLNERIEEENDSLEAAIEERPEPGVFHDINLQEGLIRVDVTGLGYSTKESFKAWVMKHAITNSEPVFNL